MSRSDLLLADVTEVILKSFFHVYNTLGYGFLEKVYENSMRISLGKVGLTVEQQKPISVAFEGELVGEYYADLLVAGKVIVELKPLTRSHHSTRPSCSTISRLRGTKWGW